MLRLDGACCVRSGGIEEKETNQHMCAKQQKAKMKLERTKAILNLQLKLCRHCIGSYEERNQFGLDDEPFVSLISRANDFGKRTYLR